MTKSINGKAVALQLEEERKKSRNTFTEKYRPIYERQAKENLIAAGKNYGVGKEEKPLVNLPNPINTVNTSEKLASIAGVSEKNSVSRFGVARLIY